MGVAGGMYLALQARQAIVAFSFPVCVALLELR